MADINKSVELKFESNADQVKSEVDGLLSSLDKTSNEYEDLERSLRDVVNAEQKLIQSEQKLTEQLGRTKGATASIEEEVRKNTIAYQNKVRELEKVRSKYQDVNTSSDKLKTSTTSLTSAVSSNGGAMGLLSELTGGLAMTFKDAGEATELFGTSLKGVRGAIIATGIGALVIIIGELVTNWDKWSNAIDGTTAALENLNNQLEIQQNKIESINGGNQLSIDLLVARGATQGEIEEATRKALEDQYNNNLRLLEVQKEISRTAKVGSDEYKDSQKEIAKLDKENFETYNKFLVLKATRETRINNEAKERADKAAEEAKKENDRRKKELADRIKAEKDAAQKIADQAKSDNLKNSQTEYEQLEEKYKRDKELLEKYKIDTTELEKKYMNDVNNLRLKDTEAEKKRNEDKLKSLTDLLDKSKQKELEYKDLKTAEEVEDFRLKQEKIITDAETERILKATELGATEEQLKQIRDYYESLRVENNKTATDTIKMQEDVVFKFRMDLWNKIGTAIGALGGLFKQHTAAAKVLALAEIAIGTATGFINALDIAQESAKATGPGAAFAFPIFYASQVASVLGAAARAKAVLSSGGSGGGGGTSAPSIPASATPNVSFVSSNENQIANTIGDTNRNAEPIRAYVVSGDVTTAQSLERNIINNSSLG